MCFGAVGLGLMHSKPDVVAYAEELGCECCSHVVLLCVLQDAYALISRIGVGVVYFGR